MSNEIDWSKAPEGSKGHGYVGLSDLPIWVGDDWYEHARDGGGRYFFSTGEDGVCAWQRGQVKNYVDRPSQAWTGQGLPPVGTVCEGYAQGLDLTYTWRKCTVLHANKEECAVMLDDSVLRWCDQFRPIRTQAQIEAEEREKAIELMMCAYAQGGFEAIYDAGYRKTEVGK